MFCNEPIQKVFRMKLKDELQLNRCNSLLQILHRFEYHTTDGLGYLFETDHFYITIGYDGVIKYEKPNAFFSEQYRIETIGDGETPSYEEVIFVGQHICDMKTLANVTTVYFDDFSMKLYTYDYEEPKWFENRASGCGDQIVPVGTHLLKKCSCGGNAQIYIDHVEDFFIRCDKCHLSTYSNMWFKKSMDAWNKGETPVFTQTTSEHFYETLKQQPIKRVLVSDRFFEKCDERSCFAEEILIEFENELIGVQNIRLSEDESIFCFSNVITDYNDEIYSHSIRSAVGKLSFICLREVYGREEMIFELDDTKLTISTNGTELLIGLAEPWENNFVEAKRKTLFE